jgi:hypothetical protein
VKAESRYCGTTYVQAVTTQAIGMASPSSDIDITYRKTHNNMYVRERKRF